MPRIEAPGAATVAPRKIGELDSIRGLAALLVVVYHLPSWHGDLHDLRAIRNLYLMVNLFFVLSGFVIALNYEDRLISIKELARFQLLLLGRLYPVHLLFLVLFALLAVGKWLAATRLHMALPNTTVLEPFPTHEFIEHLFLVQALPGHSDARSLNGPSWSISVEFYTYLVFGVLCLMLDKRYRPIAFLMLGAAALLPIITLGDAVGEYTSILQCLAGFFIGSLTATLSNRIHVTISALPALLTLLAMALFLCLKSDEQYDFLFTCSQPCSSSPSCTPGTAASGPHCAAPHPAYLGLISYSIYMSHSLIVWVVNQGVRVLLKRP